MARGKESSRERLLAAAQELLAEQGYEATTTAAVARRAGTSQSQLLKHFGDKHGLLREVLSEGWQPLNSAIRLAIARISKPYERLNLIIDMLLNFLEINAAFARVLLRDGDRLTEADSGSREFAGFLDSIFEQMRVTGQMEREVSPQLLRVALVGALKDMLRERALAPNDTAGVSDAEVRATLTTFLSSCIRAQEDVRQLPARRSEPRVVIEQKEHEEDPWLKHYLELGDVALRVPRKPGQA